MESKLVGWPFRCFPPPPPPPLCGCQSRGVSWRILAHRVVCQSHAGPQVHGHHRQSYLRKSHLRSSKYHRLLCFQSGSVFRCCLSGSANTSHHTGLNFIHTNQRPIGTHVPEQKGHPSSSFSPPPPRVANPPPLPVPQEWRCKAPKCGHPNELGKPMCSRCKSRRQLAAPKYKNGAQVPVNPPSVLSGGAGGSMPTPSPRCAARIYAPCPINGNP